MGNRGGSIKRRFNWARAKWATSCACCGCLVGRVRRCRALVSCSRVSRTAPGMSVREASRVVTSFVVCRDAQSARLGQGPAWLYQQLKAFGCPARLPACPTGGVHDRRHARTAVRERRLAAFTPPFAHTAGHARLPGPFEHAVVRQAAVRARRRSCTPPVMHTAVCAPPFAHAASHAARAPSFAKPPFAHRRSCTPPVVHTAIRTRRRS